MTTLHAGWRRSPRVYFARRRRAPSHLLTFRAAGADLPTFHLLRRSSIPSHRWPEISGFEEECEASEGGFETSFAEGARETEDRRGAQVAVRHLQHVSIFCYEYIGRKRIVLVKRPA